MPTNPHPTENIQLIFIVNGEDVSIEANIHQPLAVARDKALVDTKNTGRPFDEWEIRSSDGVMLDASATIESLRLSSGTRLFLTLQAGAGGSPCVSIPR